MAFSKLRNHLNTLGKDEQGFTLIELLVVILIIGILAGIAIPAFLNQRQSASEASVQSDLSNAAKVFETVMVKDKAYPSAIPTTVKTSKGVNLSVQSEPNVTPTPVASSTGTNKADVKFKSTATGIQYLSYSPAQTSNQAWSFAWSWNCKTATGVVNTKSMNGTLIIRPGAQEVYANLDTDCYTNDGAFVPGSITLSPYNSPYNPAGTPTFTQTHSIAAFDSTKVKRDPRESFCIQGFHDNGKVMYKYDSANGGLGEGAC